MPEGFTYEDCMLTKESLSLTVRSLCLAGAAAIVTACGGGNSPSALPPQNLTGTAGVTGGSPITTAATSAPALVQSSNGSAYAPASIAVSFSSAPAVGDVLAVAFWNNGQSSGASNTYTAPSGWSLVEQNTAHAYHTYQIFSHVVASGESNKYVFTPAAAQREHVWMAADVSHASGIDKHGNMYISGATFTTPSVTPSQAYDLALAFNMPLNSATWSNPSGWTRGVGPTATWAGEGLTRSLSSTSAISESATLSSSSSGFAGIVLLAPGGTSSSTPSPTASPSPTSASTPAPTASPTASPTSAPAGTAYTYHGCPLFTANDWLTTNLVSGGSSYVSNAVDPHSSNYINNINSNVGSINFMANTVAIDETVNLVNSSNLKATPTIQNLTYGFANDPYNDDPSPAKIEIDSGTFYQEGTRGCTSTNGDCHVVVLDTNKCVDYETYNWDGPSWNGSSYTAKGGGVENLNHPYSIEHIVVSAGDLPMMGTTDWGEDVSYQNASCQPNCAIPHIVAFLLPQPGQANGGYVSPADGTGRACSSYCSWPLPDGARLRLHSSYSCPSATSYPQANLLCNQLKQYGMIFDDTTGINGGGGIRLGTSSNGANPWNSSDYGQFLGKVHISDFDVMTLGTIH